MVIKETSASEANGTADDEIICPCFELRLGDLNAILGEDPTMSFEQFLARSGAGAKCTACLLDLEYHFVSQPRAARMRPAAGPHTAREEKVPFRRGLWALIDRLSPSVPMRLVDRLPVLAGRGIEQWIWIANQSLLYGNEVYAPDMDVGLTIRDGEGRITHDEVYDLPREAVLRINVSELLPSSASPGAGSELVLGSVEIRRRARWSGRRGTTRPQMELVSPAGSCVLHGQAPGGPRESGFLCFYRPEDERIFLSVMNAGRRPLDMDITYPLGGAAAADMHPVSARVQVPAQGARLHEVRVPQELAGRLDRKPFVIGWRSGGLRRVHVLCATPSLDRFSIDHA